MSAQHATSRDISTKENEFECYVCGYLGQPAIISSNELHGRMPSSTDPLLLRIRGNEGCYVGTVKLIACPNCGSVRTTMNRMIPMKGMKQQ